MKKGKLGRYDTFSKCEEIGRYCLFSKCVSKGKGMGKRVLG